MKRSLRVVTALAGAVLAAVGFSAAVVQAADLDEERAAWRYRRAVDLPAEGGAFVALPIPPEVGARCLAGLADVRLLETDGRETPFVVDERREREAEQEWTGTLVDSRRERKRLSQWTVDLGEARTFNTVRLLVPGEDFVKRARLEASHDTRTWSLVQEDVGLFDQPWTSRVRHTSIDLVTPVSARYLRLTVDDRRSPPIDVTGWVVASGRTLPGEQWRRTVSLSRVPSESDTTPLHVTTEPRRSRYRLDIPLGFRCEGLTLEADDAAFARRLLLEELRDVGGQEQRTTLADGLVYHLRSDDERVAVSSEPLAVQPGSGQGTLELSVVDGDSPPLRNVRVTLLGAVTRLLFPRPASGLTLTLYYGNEATRAPFYDLAALRERLAAVRDLVPAVLGPEAENPRFRAVPPLAFAATAGAALDLQRWRFVRTLTIAGPDDIYTLRLAADDLARLRPDLGDLRLADGQGRQVPYLLEADAAETSVDLAVRLEATGPRRDASGTVSRYQLDVTPSLGERTPRPLPMAALILDVAEPFFSRPVRVTVAPQGERRAAPVALFAGTLARRDTSGGPLRVALDGGRHTALSLEIDEGDNAPLTLRGAKAVVLTPRIVFKAKGGPYRLLLGHADAQPPRYDLTTLRREVLAYSATLVEPAGLEPHVAFRRGLGDYFHKAPPAVALWVTILGAVVALVLLTLRVLKQE